MRTFFRLFPIFAAFALTPACSILFDGAGYRSGGGTDAGPRDAGPRDTGPAISCGDPSMCPVGFYCETMFTSTCMLGCDEPRDCTVPGESCNDVLHECQPAVACMDDGMCDPSQYCESAVGECRSCDFDEDRWFDRDAPARCAARPGLDFLGGGDCDDRNPAVHPFAPPDCDPTTTETCGTGVGMLPPEVFELGLVATAEFSAAALPESLHVLTMEAAADGARLLLVYRDSAGVPYFMTASLTNGSVTPTDPGVLVDWAVSGTVLGSQLGVVRIPEGGAFVGSVEVINDPGVMADNFATEYGMRVEPDGSVLPAEPGASFRQPLVLAAVPTAVSGLVATYDFTLGGSPSATMGAIVKETDAAGGSTDALYLIGINHGHFERSIAFFPTGAGYNGAVSSHVGGFFYGTGRSDINWWNGGLADRTVFVRFDSLSSYRSGAASGRDGGNAFGVSVSSMGSRTLSATGIDCNAGIPGTTSPSCATTGPFPLMTTVDLSGGGGGDPLLAADHIGGRAFMVVGRSSMTAGPMAGLVATLVDFGSGAAVGTSAVLPVGGLADATDIDLSIGLAGAPGGAAVTVGFGMTTPDTVRYGAFRICSSMGGGM